MTGIHLDHAATTTLRPEAREALLDALDHANANASGTHAPARAARNALEDARERAADMLGVGPQGIVFTSGGTEADNLAITGVLAGVPGSHVIISAIEHKAVTEAAARMEASGHSVTVVGCDSDGTVHPGHVVPEVLPNTALVSVMSANNEVGALQPVADIVDEVRSVNPGTIVHTDAVQAFVGAELPQLIGDADMVSLAAHKFGGPKGVGLLSVRRGEVSPMIVGGGQEAGRRSGTSNVPGVVAMVAAMEAVVRDRGRFEATIGAERDAFETALVGRLGDPAVTAARARRMPHFSHIRFPGVVAETLLIRLDAVGVFAAAGSACQSGAVEPSHVLTAMGMSDRAAAECVRFTFGWDAQPGDGIRAASEVAAVVEALR